MRTRLLRATLMTAFLIGLGSAAPAQVKAPPTDPKMKLQGLDGKMYDLAGLRGSVVLVSFGATWCAPCSTELRALQALLTVFRDKPATLSWVTAALPDAITKPRVQR